MEVSTRELTPKHTVEFKASGRGKAQCVPDDRYPNGCKLDFSTAGNPSCQVILPYLAPECGIWIVSCQHCDLSVAATAAGRPDDPKSIRMACLPVEVAL